MGTALPADVIGFCQDIFARDGAILHGAGGGRFVYDLRKQFDLFCKFSPIKVADELLDSGHLKPEHLHGVDVVVVRENSAGIYQGKWREGLSVHGERWAEHSFSYHESEVRRILEVAAGVARLRRNHVTVVYKESGIPTISSLWRDCMSEVAASTGVSWSVLDIDYAAYRLAASTPGWLDVVAAPNLFGDLLSDLGGILMGSRGLTFSGNYSSSRASVYQTNHGAAHDLAGTDRANPVGQIFSLAMMLRESFGLAEEAALIEGSVAQVWRDGWRTDDLAEKGCRLCGMSQMADLVAEAVADRCCAPCRLSQPFVLVVPRPAVTLPKPERLRKNVEADLPVCQGSGRPGGLPPHFF